MLSVTRCSETVNGIRVAEIGCPRDRQLHKILQKPDTHASLPTECFGQAVGACFFIRTAQSLFSHSMPPHFWHPLLPLFSSGCDSHDF